MNPDIVVDIGNSLVKWGRCAEHEVVERVSLPADAPEAWQKQLDAWKLAGPLSWAVASVVPAHREFLVKWLRNRGHSCLVIERAAQLPLTVGVNEPDKVGIDRLLNAVAAKRWRSGEDVAIIVDAGSAVTVDCVDDKGRFCGGAIFPGLRLMAECLHEHTALLPLVRVDDDNIEVPGRDTIKAMETGILYAVAGGIAALVHEFVVRGTPSLDAMRNVDTFVTGGDAPLLVPTLKRLLLPIQAHRLIPSFFMTLEGIRMAAEALP
ncbi:MAG: type III pantothenate kinase [Gemmataceae bacterium]